MKAIESIVRVCVVRRILVDFKAGASLLALSRRYGLTRDAVEHLIRLSVRRSRRAI